MLDVQMGGGTTSLKDFYRDKVLNGTFDIDVTLTPVASRCTLTEGKIGIDTTNKMVYVYADLTCITTFSNQYFLQMSNNFTNTYLPQYTGSARNNDVGLITDPVSTRQMAIWAGYSSDGMRIGSYNSGKQNGDHYIVYGSWTY